MPIRSIHWNTYKHKINYYQCLKKILTEAGFEANVEAIIIGSLGTVHNKALNVLTNQNMNERTAEVVLDLEHHISQATMEHKMSSSP